MAPAAWLLLCVLAMDRAFETSAAHSWRWLFSSGLFLGLAISAYFIYSFYLPAFAVALIAYSRRAALAERFQRPWKNVALPWLGGLAIGGSAYVLGYILLACEVGGVSESIRFIRDLQGQLGAFASPLSLAERVSFSWAMLESVIHNLAHHVLIFGKYVLLPGSGLKTFVLLAIPLAAWACAEYLRAARMALRILIMLPCSFFAVSLIFGGRLGAHHFMALLPVSYAALALAANAITERTARNPARAAMLWLSPFVALIALNLAGQVREAHELKETRGVGLFSDAINRLAIDLTSAKQKPYVYFPDWGLSWPVALISRGTVPMGYKVDARYARQMLCEGRRS